MSLEVASLAVRYSLDLAMGHECRGRQETGKFGVKVLQHISCHVTNWRQSKRDVRLKLGVCSISERNQWVKHVRWNGDVHRIKMTRLLGLRARCCDEKGSREVDVLLSEWGVCWRLRRLQTGGKRKYFFCEWDPVQLVVDVPLLAPHQPDWYGSRFGNGWAA